MTDTDIAALIERLRKVKAETAREAADALEACQAKLATVAEPVDDGIGRFTICVEKLLCEKLGKPWRASGISIATLVDELAARAEKAEAALAQHVVHSALQPTTEAKNSMPDLADFADELETLVREMLDAGVDRAAVKETLTAKLQELQDEEAGDAEEAPEDETA